MSRSLIPLAGAALTIALPIVAIGQTSPRTKGDVREMTIPSKTYPGGRHAWVYTPPGYPASCGEGCNLILAFDGSMYLGAMPMPEILDSLGAATRTPSTVAILFDNGPPPGRLEDLANSRRFASFIANELMPWVRQHYVVSHSSNRAIIAGSSAGALAAAYIAHEHPELFGNVLSQSGAFWRGNEGSNAAPYEWVTQQYATSARVSVRFFIDVGALETAGAMGGAAPSLIDANRRLRDALVAKGYAVEYFEVPGGQHSPDTWRKRLAIGIAALALPGPCGAPGLNCDARSSEVGPRR